MTLQIYTLGTSAPREWKIPGCALQIVSYTGPQNISAPLQKLFAREWQVLPAPTTTWLVRSFYPGASNPVVESLASVLEVKPSDLRLDLALECTRTPSENELQWMHSLWKEPAIEELRVMTWNDYSTWLSNARVAERVDSSFEAIHPNEIGLEFSNDEMTALLAAAEKRGHDWNRAEWELFAQTWSEHCKHKIFNAEISLPGEKRTVHSLFKTCLREPALQIADKNKKLYLSLFHDNAGVLRIKNPNGEDTEWAIAAKMETHNSPSAISPYGGASTGVVGVHRDILGTGLGALPIANWDVLCFESPEHQEQRPETALPPDVIRRGVLRGIQDGGNQSGIPTVQGSVCFDPRYAVKPLVYAGALGILPVACVEKKPNAGDRLFLIGGATGADGLRGAVMSSRDLRSEDFSGSAVQVANAFTQRRLTDFLMDAREQNLISAITDNGAGGIASSVGEMATLTGGAEIDVSEIRLKQNIHAWERVLSESQERMTVATSEPEKFRELLREWKVPFDELGKLSSSGFFRVLCFGKMLIDVDLETLHDGPQLKLSSIWSAVKERALTNGKAALAINYQSEDHPPGNLGRYLLADEAILTQKQFTTLLRSPAYCSREEIIRRFDHEVQGRTLRKPFAGRTQASPTDGSLLEIYETESYVALAHGVHPANEDFTKGLLLSIDDAVKKYLLATGRLDAAGFLDNFSWPDPTTNDESLWRLVHACEILQLATETFSIPFVSGKDSMKNNSREYRIPETLVVSIFGSARGPEQMPVSFFTEAGKNVFWWKPIDSNIGPVGVLKKLYSRYTQLEEWIAARKILSAKSCCNNLPAKTLFEMTLGREVGIEKASEELKKHMSSLGSLLIVFRDEVSKPTDLISVAKTSADFVWRWQTQTEPLLQTPNTKLPTDTWSLATLRTAYLERGKKGFWS